MRQFRGGTKRGQATEASSGGAAAATTQGWATMDSHAATEPRDAAQPLYNGVESTRYVSNPVFKTGVGEFPVLQQLSQDGVSNLHTNDDLPKRISIGSTSNW